MGDISVKLDVILSLAFSPLILFPILHLLLYPSFPPPPTMGPMLHYLSSSQREIQVGRKTELPRV